MLGRLSPETRLSIAVGSSAFFGVEFERTLEYALRGELKGEIEVVQGIITFAALALAGTAARSLHRNLRQ